MTGISKPTAPRHDALHGSVQDSTTTAHEQIRHMSDHKSIRRRGSRMLPARNTCLRGRHPDGLGRDRKNDEQLVGTPDAMVPLKRRVERRWWGTALLNAMVWDP